MKTIIVLLLSAAVNIFSQEVSVIISANKSEYRKTYSLNKNTDPIILTYTLFNNTADTVLIKFEPFFELTYTGNGYEGYSHCFRMEPVIIDGERVGRYYLYNQYSSFVKVAPADSMVFEGEFDIFWPCRGAPPRDDWKFNITYIRELNNDDNFYLVKGSYTDFTSKEFITAWEGELESNTISITVLRDK